MPIVSVRFPSNCMVGIYFPRFICHEALYVGELGVRRTDRGMTAFRFGAYWGLLVNNPIWQLGIISLIYRFMYTVSIKAFIACAAAWGVLKGEILRKELSILLKTVKSSGVQDRAEKKAIGSVKNE